LNHGAKVIQLLKYVISLLGEDVWKLLMFLIAEDEPLPGWSRFYITDPWGNRIELLERCEE